MRLDPKQLKQVPTQPEFGALFNGGGDEDTAFFPSTNGAVVATSSASPLNTESIYRAPTPQTYTSFSWESPLADATTVLQVFKNVVLFGSITLTGASGTKAFALTLAASETLALTFHSGTGPGAINCWFGF